MAKISPQEKKNVKQRFLTLWNGIKNEDTEKMTFRWVGSLSGGEATKNDDGTYDLDVDTGAKFLDKNAQQARHDYMSKLIKKNLKKNETMVQKKRVIRINLRNAGGSGDLVYNFDIAVCRSIDNEFEYIALKNKKDWTPK